MNLTETWELFRARHPHGSPLTVKQFVDIKSFDMIEYEMTVCEKSDKEISDLVSTIEKMISYISPDINLDINHKRKLLGKKQVRCTWCSRYNLVERKTTIKCIECDKIFCHDN